MKFFSDCRGKCCVCACGDFCLAGYGDDDYRLASKQQIIDRLNKGDYKNYTDYMINTLKFTYAFEYTKPGPENVANKENLIN